MRFSSPKFGQSALPHGPQGDLFFAFGASSFVASQASFGGPASAGILASATDWPDGSSHDDLVFFPVLAPFEAGSASAEFASLPAETVFGVDGLGQLLLGPMDWPEGTGRDGLSFFPALLPLGTDPLPADAGAGLVI